MQKQTLLSSFFTTIKSSQNPSPSSQNKRPRPKKPTPPPSPIGLSDSDDSDDSEQEATHISKKQRSSPESSLAEREFVRNERQEARLLSRLTPPPPPGPSSAKSKSKFPNPKSLTPLERQFTKIKQQNPDVLLFVENGYRFSFFGDDAQIAAKELAIGCFRKKNFMNASIPTNRLMIHVPRLVHAGYKVGVVRQVETRAIKATTKGKSKVFKRELKEVYTKATFIDQELTSVDSLSTKSVSYILALCETVNTDINLKNTNSISMGITAVNVYTGDILYSEFQDDYSRENLESRLVQLNPSELVIPNSLSNPTRKLLSRLYPSSSHDLRIEETNQDIWTKQNSESVLTEYFTDPTDTDTEMGNPNLISGSDALHFIQSLPDHVVICIAQLIPYLTQYNLSDIFYLTKNINSFQCLESRMQLTANTMQHLEILSSPDAPKGKWSLLWVLDHTVTPFGSRMLRQWLSSPLYNKEQIESRLDAVEALVSSSVSVLDRLMFLLPKLPDLETGLIRCHYAKCSPKEFIMIAKCFLKICKGLPDASDIVSIPNLLQSILHSIPKEIENPISAFMDQINIKSIEEDKKLDLFDDDEDKFPNITKWRRKIVKVKQELGNHLKELKKQFGRPQWTFVTKNNFEYILEISHKEAKKTRLPKDWVQRSSTKTMGRYHTPFVMEQINKLELYRERLILATQSAWTSFLKQFASDLFDPLRQIVKALARLDCLRSLAIVASSKEGYTRPTITDTSSQIMIKNGRHPIVESLMTDTFVPNSVSMSSDDPHCMILTGPNMGGKTSLCKQVALICILAQIGSFVPADAVSLSPVDSVLVRMGGSDNIIKGQSTFLVELQETSSILRKATSRSLIILDELGRGTSTHDGVAIAYATLQYIVEHINCFTLFITHYPLISELANRFPKQIKCYHMAFLENPDESSQHQQITFLYKLEQAAAEKSYGLNVARLAELPSSILEIASEKSLKLENSIQQRRLRARFRSTFLQIQKVLQESKN